MTGRIDFKFNGTILRIRDIEFGAFCQVIARNQESALADPPSPSLTRVVNSTAPPLSRAGHVFDVDRERLTRLGKV